MPCCCVLLIACSLIFDTLLLLTYQISIRTKPFETARKGLSLTLPPSGSVRERGVPGLRARRRGDARHPDRGVARQHLAAGGAAQPARGDEGAAELWRHREVSTVFTLFTSHPSWAHTHFCSIFWCQVVLKPLARAHAQDTSVFLVLYFGTTRCVLYTSGYGSSTHIQCLLRAVQICINLRFASGIVS